MCAGFHGFVVGGVEDPRANSWVRVLPIRTPPPRSATHTGASSKGTLPEKRALPASVGIPAVSIRSLTATGIPSSGLLSPGLEGPLGLDCLAEGGLGGDGGKGVDPLPTASILDSSASTTSVGENSRERIPHRVPQCRVDIAPRAFLPSAVRRLVRYATRPYRLPMR